MHPTPPTPAHPKPSQRPPVNPRVKAALIKTLARTKTARDWLKTK